MFVIAFRCRLFGGIDLKASFMFVFGSATTPMPPCVGVCMNTESPSVMFAPAAVVISFVAVSTAIGSYIDCGGDSSSLSSSSSLNEPHKFGFNILFDDGIEVAGVASIELIACLPLTGTTSSR